MQKLKILEFFKEDSVLNITKISIIILVGLYVIGNFEPFFDGKDSYLYGIVAINFSSVESGLDSGISFIVAVKYGSSEIMSFSSNLFFP